MIKGKDILKSCLGYAQLIGWMAFLFACSSDNSMEQQPEAALETVRIAVQTKAGGADVLESERKEYEISTLRIYVFDGENKLVGYHYGSQYNGSQTDITMKLPTGSLTFYTIANEGAAGDLKRNNGEVVKLDEKNMTPAILESLTFATLPEATYASGGDSNKPKDETGKIYESPNLPMANILVQEVSSNSFVEITLKRSVAKMKLYFSTTGAGECYMGRGLYLYNEPQYGYLFARNAYSGEIDRREWKSETKPSGWENDKFYNDSPQYQLNGRIILHSGWPDEPNNLENKDRNNPDINKITANRNNPSGSQYDLLPQKSFYLFANPNTVANPLGSDAVVSTTPPSGDGYYLKILVHQHGKGATGDDKHKGEMFYLSMPEVKANDCISIYSTVTLDGDITLYPRWMIREWTTGGGDITFN